MLNYNGFQQPRGLPPLPQQPLTPITPSNDVNPSFFTTGCNDDWSTASRIAVAAVTSQGTMGGLLVAGFVS